MKQFLNFLLIILFSLPVLNIGCNSDSDNGLAPYEGARPLTILRISRSTASDIKWLGGRVAAVGVNKGLKAALDSTLIWLRTATDNSISSYVSFGSNTDTVNLLHFGASLKGSLVDSGWYTFWLAKRNVFDVNLDSGALNVYDFVDTTMMMKLNLAGKAGGHTVNGVLVDSIKIRIDEKFTGTTFVVEWNHPTSAYRRIAVTQASTASFDPSKLIWHVVTPDSISTDNITSPVVLGVSPPNTTVIVPYPESGLKYGTVYTVWMTKSKWNGDFRPSALYMAWYRINAFYE